MIMLIPQKKLSFRLFADDTNIFASKKSKDLEFAFNQEF